MCRGAFRGESVRGHSRGHPGGRSRGRFRGPLVGILVDPLVGSNFAVRVLCACQIEKGLA